MGTKTPDQLAPELADAAAGYEATGPADAFPVPVFAVEPVPVDQLALRAWSASRTPVPNGAAPAVQVAAGQPFRRRLHVHNAGTVTVYLSPQQAAATEHSGYPLPAGATVELATRETVWAGVAADAADAGDVATLAQHIDG